MVMKVPHLPVQKPNLCGVLLGGTVCQAFAKK
jgi:hypothetical protein